MKIKVSKHKLNIHYRGSPRGGRTQQHAYCLRYAHSQHNESHLAKKQPQAKIPIAFLFSQLHFNNVTSHALFYGGHFVMPRKRRNSAPVFFSFPKRRIAKYSLATRGGTALVNISLDACGIKMRKRPSLS